jgi:hypothetical protein
MGQLWDNTAYPDSNDLFGGNTTWAPNGYISHQDEYNQQLALINPHMVNMAWSRELAFQEKGDEFYGGSTYAYIPTEMQIASLVRRINLDTPTEGPVHFNEPGQLQIVQSLYQSLNELWRKIREAGGTGW